MEHFSKIADYDVAPLVRELDAHGLILWDSRTGRTKSTTFHGTSDIWVRFRDPRELVEPRHYAEPHLPVWYPEVHLLPSVKPICFDLMARVEAEMLGGVLITRVPAGGCILSHNDKGGGWHPNFYNTKVYVVLKGNADCVNTCGDETTVIRPGEAVTFDNLIDHAVVNNGETERVTLIVCMRT